MSEQLAPTGRVEGHSLARHWWRGTTFALGALLLNAAALFLAARPSEVAPSHIPSVVLVGIAGVQLLLFGFWLERERPMSWQSAASPQIQRTLVQRTLFAVALSIVSALPSVYLLRHVPRATHAAVLLVEFSACVPLLAFYQSALWLERLSSATRPSFRSHVTQASKATLFLMAAFIGLDFAPLPALGLLVGFVAAYWHTAAQRLPSALGSSAPSGDELRAMDAFIVFAFVIGAMETTHILLGRADMRGVSNLVSSIGVGCAATAASLLYLRYRGVARLRERLGLVWGRGPKVIIREALLWSLIASVCAVGSLFIDIFTVPLASTVAGLSIPALAHASPAVVLSTVCLVSPVAEEITCRGLFHRALRSGWGRTLSLLVNALVFACMHPRAPISVFCMAACATLAFERSRSLYAAMLTHGAYNMILLI